MVPLFQILGPSLVPLLSKTGPLFGPSEGLFEGRTRLVITAALKLIGSTLKKSNGSSAKGLRKIFRITEPVDVQT